MGCDTVEKDKSKSKKGIKNYIILIVIFVLCFGFTIYLCEWYNVYSDYKKQTPIIRGTLSEINTEDLDHYVVDVPSVIVYICTSYDDDCRSFEKNFKKYVNKKDLNDSIVYLNISDVDKEQFVNDFNSKYNYKTRLNGNYPAFISFKDGKIDSILQSDVNKELSISKVDSFLELNMYEEEW